MIIKLDLEKAFDSIEWSFIKMMLDSTAFPQPLVKLIMSYITTSSLSVLINGTPTPFFYPFKGVRKGDPLSHAYSVYAWKTCLSKYKSILIKRNGNLLSSGTATLKFTHFFADDILLVARANSQSVNTISKLLDHSSQISGLKLNYGKYKVLFSSNTPNHIAHNICQTLGIKKTLSLDKYLGFTIKQNMRSPSSYS